MPTVARKFLVVFDCYHNISFNKGSFIPVLRENMLWLHPTVDLEIVHHPGVCLSRMLLELQQRAPLQNYLGVVVVSMDNYQIDLNYRSRTP